MLFFYYLGESGGQFIGIGKLINGIHKIRVRLDGGRGGTGTYRAASIQHIKYPSESNALI